MKYLIILLALTGCVRKEVKTYEVPVEACKSQYTGRTNSYTVQQNNCYAYNSDGQCTMNMPSYHEITSREVKVICNYTEWR